MARDLLSKDILTGDLFAGRHEPEAGSLACSVEIAHTMAEAVKASPYTREQIAERMSRYIGARVSTAMINAYTSEAREAHNVSLERAIAFDQATESNALLKLHARKCSAVALTGRDALHAELGRIAQEKRQLAEQERALQILMRKA